jgi:transposase-like protein
MARKDKELEMFKIVEECLSSGSKKSEVIQKYGLRHQTYYYWQHKYLESKKRKSFKRAASKNKEASTFHEIDLSLSKKEVDRSQRKTLEISTKGGLTITIFE